MNNSKIRLNDGSEYAVDFCGLADGVVAFRLEQPGTLLETAQIFADAGATGKITYLFPNELVPDQPIVAGEYIGYTRLIGVLVDRWEGTPLVQLTKGE